MTRHEFKDITKRSVMELLRISGTFIACDLQAETVQFEVVQYDLSRSAQTGHSVFTEMACDLDGFVNTMWKDGFFPEQIRVVISRLGRDIITIRAFPSLKLVKNVDRQWYLENGVNAEVATYLPYYLRLPRPPKGWMEFNEAGIPDFGLSLARHGKYSVGQ